MKAFPSRKRIGLRTSFPPDSCLQGHHAWYFNELFTGPKRSTSSLKYHHGMTDIVSASPNIQLQAQKPPDNPWTGDDRIMLLRFMLIAGVYYPNIRLSNSSEWAHAAQHGILDRQYGQYQLMAVNSSKWAPPMCYYQLFFISKLPIILPPSSPAVRAVENAACNYNAGGRINIHHFTIEVQPLPILHSSCFIPSLSLYLVNNDKYCLFRRE